MKIGIQGHPDRGEDVKKLLETLTNNPVEYSCDNPCVWYEVHDRHVLTMVLKSPKYKYYTLEEFEEEFPFKIGDVVQTVPHGQPGIITELCLDHTYVIIYKIQYNSKRELLFPSQMLKLYTPMKEERNITLTLDKAKEWYNKGGELKEIALQAFSEKELNPLPKSWEEYCKMYYVPKTDLVFGPCIPNKYVALWKLEQLRNCYRQGWKPKWNSSTSIPAIHYTNEKFSVYSLYTRTFLSFQSRRVAEEFLKNFEPLMKEAGDLI